MYSKKGDKISLIRKEIRDINKSQKFFIKEKNLTPEYWSLETKKIKLKQELKKITKKSPTKAQLERKEYKKLVRLADKYFAEFIKLRDTDIHGNGQCITCDKFLKYLKKEEGEIKTNGKVQCCHWIPRGYYSHRWEEENCYMGCNHCNTFDQENHHNILTLVQVERHGQERVQEQLQTKNRVKPRIEELRSIVKRYKQKSESLRKAKSL